MRALERLDEHLGSSEIRIDFINCLNDVYLPHRLKRPGILVLTSTHLVFFSIAEHDPWIEKYRLHDIRDIRFVKSWFGRRRSLKVHDGQQWHEFYDIYDDHAERFIKEIKWKVSETKK
ncbi:hypothetical protein [Thalassobacillus sp. CUG 92003]|uniref:hypothetical protein n=1 Tax=Thalassobacillus sp. CUG 92003 TaxID=2736641 RepID=UPI0015E71E75|nr:hypothetical protein [Thalassobacillus sp. CUG 92003]